MSKDDTLRRGKPETRSHFERAKDAFNDAKGETRVTERTVECPDCAQPMRLTKSYKGKDSYRVTGVCSADPSHNIERYGYFVTEGSES